MALVIYPAQDADSFITVADATTAINELTMDSAAWAALGDDDKERLLRIAYRDILNKTADVEYPDPLPSCIPEAQALMASHDNVNAISSGADVAQLGAIKKQKVGSISKEFYDVKGGVNSPSISRVPQLVVSCLEEFGYVFSSGITGLKQTNIGRM